MYIKRINVTVLQGSTVIKQLEQIKIINASTNPNEVKRLSQMTIDELNQHALQEAENLITSI